MSMFKTLALAAALACAAANAAAATVPFGEYTVTFDDTVLGSISGAGGDSSGDKWFTFNLLQPDGTANYVGGTSANVVNIPSVTITANAGYSLSNLRFYFTGGYIGGSAQYNIGGNTSTVSHPKPGTFTDYVSLSSFSTTAGSVTLSGLSYGAETGFRFAVSAVPEPETYAMMLAGLGAVGFMARRRKAR